MAKPKLHPLTKDGRKPIYLKIPMGGSMPKEIAAFSVTRANELVRQGKAYEIDTKGNPIIPAKETKKSAPKPKTTQAPANNTPQTTEGGGSKTSEAGGEGELDPKNPFLMDQFAQPTAKTLAKANIVTVEGLKDFVAAGNSLEALGVTPAQAKLLTETYSLAAAE